MTVIEVNGRSYVTPERSVVAICVDGCEPAYLEDAIAAGVAPTFARWRDTGTWTIAEGAMPSFTNPNNVSIVSGVPPAVHGITGNHFRNARAEDVPMSSRKHLLAPTVLEVLSEHVPVAAFTVKHKLTELLSGGRVRVESAERGLPDPIDPYDPHASLAVLDAGARALEQGVRFLYLTTTDYVQHKHAPGSEEARAFYAAFDARLAALERRAAIVGLTADHGMNDKTKADGSPNVVYLGTILDAAFGERAHVTLPITDPYVVHHGALGGCAMIYFPPHRPLVDHEALAREALEQVAGVERVLDRNHAARELDLHPDRIGDLVVLATKDAVLGKRPEEHDLTHVGRGLRSHGSLHERRVPFAINRRVSTLPSPLRSYDLFDVLLNRA
jgi:phosphonoacetate hydrolase